MRWAPSTKAPFDGVRRDPVPRIPLDDLPPNLFMMGGGWQLGEVSSCQVGLIRRFSQRSKICVFRDFMYLCFAGNGYALPVSIGCTRLFAVDMSRDLSFTYWRASSDADRNIEGPRSKRSMTVFSLLWPWPASRKLRAPEWQAGDVSLLSLHSRFSTLRHTRRRLCEQGSG